MVSPDGDGFVIKDSRRGIDKTYGEKSQKGRKVSKKRRFRLFKGKPKGEKKLEREHRTLFKKNPKRMNRQKARKTRKPEVN